MSGTTPSPLAVAERILGLLDDGSFSATYKFAVLVGLMDLCLEKTTATGAPPTMVTTRELAEKVIELYWPQAAPFVLESGTAILLRQSTQRSRGPTGTAIGDAIVRFRMAEADDPGQSCERARLRAPTAFTRLVDDVEWKLVEMPLGKLQKIGREEERFLYEYAWREAERPPESAIRAYQRGRPDAFDNRLLLKDGVGESLVRLNTVLRPALLREWLLRVIAFNKGVFVEEALEAHLFGRDRIDLSPVRAPLVSLQAGRCFYCEGRFTGSVEVDHFVPWARHPNDALENLVASHPKCNGEKRDFLAASAHVERWAARNAGAPAMFDAIARETGWARAGGRTVGVARALYLNLPAEARLWAGQGAFERLGEARGRIEQALRAA